MTRKKQCEFRKPSAKETIILELLLGGKELYGLEMIRKRPRDLKRGTIYVTLDRMEDKGLIRSKEIKTPEGAQGPPRRVYQITGHGSQVMEIMSMAAGMMKDGRLGGGYV
jgi:DNA-binding PadR family transcriptional regulator